MTYSKIHITLIVSFVLVVLNANLSYAQSTYKTSNFNFDIKKVVRPATVKNDWFAFMQNKEAVKEGNITYQSYLNDIKKKIDHYPYSFVHKAYNMSRKEQMVKVDTPEVVYSKEGNPYNGSMPNDNTMAISNNGIVVAAINTNIIFYDTQADSLLKIISLAKFSDTLTSISSHQYDPKAIYDYKEDRFILVYLSGNKSYDSHIIIAFSQTSDPMGNWNLYTLPGNPLADTSWSDYPAIALNNDELFITMNLLKDGGSWQTSFKQSVVWQIDKFKGYKGDSLRTKLYHDIVFDGKNIRNIHPIRGGDLFYGPELYLLSNQNFALESDTFYLLKISNRMYEVSANLKVDLLISDVKYGMPPNARQLGSKRLATNDARVLGGFYQNGQIQFVGNSLRIYVDVDTFRVAGFYHGVIRDVSQTPSLKLNIFNDDSLIGMEYAYPNISYCGRSDHSQQSIITFDYASKNHYPSFGSCFFEKDNAYSRLNAVKEGDSEIRVLFSAQRWGDYTGSQPKYNEPGVVWASGTYGKRIGSKKAYGTWIAALRSPKNDRERPSKEFYAKAYPNPPQNHTISIDFNLPQNQIVQVELFDIRGHRMALLYKAEAMAGKNTFSFSTASLENGFYIIRISNKDDLLYSQKITVVQ